MGAVTGLTALGADGTRPPDGASASERTVPRGVPPAKPAPTPTPTPTPRPAAWTPAKLTALETPVRELSQLSPAAPPKSIALTLDDGPHPEWTPRILDLLAEEEVRATFFIIGEQVKEYPRLTRRIADSGHQICNHTETHPMSFDGLPKKKIRKEIADAHDRIADATGVVPQFFRAPGGAWSKAVLELTAEKGMLPIDWAVDPRDWARPGVRRIRKALLKGKDGQILLCHDGGGDRSQTLKALEDAIPKLKKRGLTFVAL
ncbi:polysaccharide deacetylase family protein [Actinomadura sp. KC345]|uniref:polysaccharide deacetylase family protein n=1 Tax=Actinomadura sp. KC345 TaxID=2530371 RepID=UPI0010518893|nr:polysaccharide deacetylase family protein [Actinomadura sp. KC345]TDC58220.1 polysaccharide deacetylase family protein [Actinomadura sp. KC345]